MLTMSRNYKFRDQNKLYFISFATVNWIDVLTRPVYKDIIVKSILYCIENKGLEVYAWCIMTNHVHMIIGTTKNKMEFIIRDLKRHSSKEILTTIENNTTESRKDCLPVGRQGCYGCLGELGKEIQIIKIIIPMAIGRQQNNQPIELFSNEMMDQKLDYIHENPVKEGIVAKPEDYLYSSAIDYSGGKGLVPIIFIE